MLLHFVIDGKLTDQFIENFLQVSDSNHFLVFGTNGYSGFKRITRTGSFLSTYNENTDDINNIINKFKADVIVLHSLSYGFAKAILKIKKEITICWGVWGHDVYDLPRIEPQIYAPKTQRFLIRSNPGLILKRLVLRNDILRRSYLEKIKGKEDFIEVIYKAHKKISFFITYIEEDFEIFSMYYPNKMRFIRSTFSTIDQYLAGNKNLSILPNAENILLGNSSAPSTNYLDAMSILSRNINQLKKVYVVLSYGSDHLHKKEILLTGRKLLKEHFHPLLDFMGRMEYIQLLQSCSVGIFYNYRQRAMGNIIAMLYMGSRVYLSNRNPAYNYFLRNGIVVNNLGKEFDKYGINRLEEDVVKSNRERLDSIFSKEKVIEDLKKLKVVLTSN